MFDYHLVSQRLNVEGDGSDGKLDGQNFVPHPRAI